MIPTHREKICQITRARKIGEKIFKIGFFICCRIPLLEKENLKFYFALLRVSQNSRSERIYLPYNSGKKDEEDGDRWEILREKGKNYFCFVYRRTIQSEIINFISGFMISLPLISTILSPNRKSGTRFRKWKLSGVGVNVKTREKDGSSIEIVETT